MITTTVGHLVNAEPALRRLGDQSLPITVSYRLARLLDKVQAELAVYHRQREKLITTYGGEPTGTPPTIAVKPEHWAMFVREISEVLQEPATLDAEAFDLHAIGDLPMSAGDVQALGPLVTFNGDGPSTP